jgi:hypothetical protein
MLCVRRVYILVLCGRVIKVTGYRIYGHNAMNNIALPLSDDLICHSECQPPPPDPATWITIPLGEIFVGL